MGPYDEWLRKRRTIVEILVEPLNSISRKQGASVYTYAPMPGRCPWGNHCIMSESYENVQQDGNRGSRASNSSEAISPRFCTRTQPAVRRRTDPPLHIRDFRVELPDGAIDPLQALEMAAEDLSDLAHGIFAAILCLRPRTAGRQRKCVDRVNHLHERR